MPDAYEHALNTYGSDEDIVREFRNMAERHINTITSNAIMLEALQTADGHRLAKQVRLLCDDLQAQLFDEGLCRYQKVDDDGNPTEDDPQEPHNPLPDLGEYLADEAPEPRPMRAPMARFASP